MILKPKKGFLEDELNIEKLTPIQWSGILRAMDKYAEYYHKYENSSESPWRDVTELPKEMPYLMSEKLITIDKKGNWTINYYDFEYKRWNENFHTPIKWKYITLPIIEKGESK